MLGILPGLATWMLMLAAKAESITSMLFGAGRGRAKERESVCDREPKASHAELELMLESKVRW